MPGSRPPSPVRFADRTHEGDRARTQAFSARPEDLLGRTVEGFADRLAVHLHRAVEIGAQEKTDRVQAFAFVT